MKAAYAADLAADQTVTTFFLVCDKEIRTSQNTGKQWLHLELGDRSGTIAAKMWEGFEDVTATFERDDVVKVQGRVKLYKNRNEISIEKIRPARSEEYDWADLMPHTKADVEQLYARLREFVAAVQNPWLAKLLVSIVEDPQIIPRLKRAPAAKTMHHAYIGGLLEHIISLCGLCRAVLAHYKEVDADLVLTGAILHDIGKIHELSYDRSLGYTTEGELLGHILLEYEIVTKRMDAIEGFPPALKTIVQHLLLSHHGRLEFGSPRVPMFPEAVLLHYLDDLDSKLGAASATLERSGGEGDWSEWNSALGRKLLRLDRYLRGEKEFAPAAPQQLKLEPPEKSR